MNNGKINDRIPSIPPRPTLTVKILFVTIIKSTEKVEPIILMIKILVIIRILVMEVYSPLQLE